MSSKKKKGDSDDGGEGDPVHPLLVALYVMLGAFVVVVIICGALYYYRSQQQLSAPSAIFTAASDDDPSSSVSWATQYRRVFDDNSSVLISNSRYTGPVIRKQFFILADAIQNNKNAPHDAIMESLASEYGNGDERLKSKYRDVYQHVLPQILEDMQDRPAELERQIRTYYGLGRSFLEYDQRSDTLAM